ncbi:hypothetical protein QUB68_21910 [Microcoleus sp. A006_D1]|uniref:hypothetical protein n=1 Tax=Microcoleus sp. A006_D1 TaxID=3055267 RepID=UPI002FD28D2D
MTRRRSSYHLFSAQCYSTLLVRDCAAADRPGATGIALDPPDAQNSFESLLSFGFQRVRPGSSAGFLRCGCEHSRPKYRILECSRARSTPQFNSRESEIPPRIDF